MIRFIRNMEYISKFIVKSFFYFFKWIGLMMWYTFKMVWYLFVPFIWLFKLIFHKKKQKDDIEC